MPHMAVPAQGGKGPSITRLIDRFLLATVLCVSLLALSSYHRATRTITLSTTLHRDSANSTTAYVVVRDSETLGLAKKELAVTVIAGSGGGASTQQFGGGPRSQVLLRYTACTGLINQQYSHIAAFSLAAALRADIVLPPAVCRDSFAHRFHTKKEKNEMTWSPIPTEDLLDVDRITQLWARHGIMVYKAPALTPFPDMMEPRTAFPAYPYQAPLPTPRAVARLEGVYLKPKGLQELVGMAGRAIANATRAASTPAGRQQLQQLLGGGAVAAEEGVVVLDIPCTFFSLQTTDVLPLVSKVALNLPYNPSLVAMADRVVELMTNGGRRPYNGVHLRVEKDAQDWVLIMGGEGQMWHLYIEAMIESAFDKDSPVYVATGLLSYGAGEDWDYVKTLFKERDLASVVHCKEDFVPDFTLQGLNSEQLALLDFLILSRSQRFVGFGSSTFSYYLREYRALQGVPRNTSLLLNSSRIGTDKLFAAAGMVALEGGAEEADYGGMLGWLRQAVGASGGA